MKKEEFDDYVEKECKKAIKYVHSKSMEMLQEEKIEYMKTLGYEIHYPKEEDEFKVIFVSKNDGSRGMRPNLETAFKYEKSKELEKKNNNLFCNKCGGDMKKYYSEYEGDPYGLVNAKVSGGYLSDPLEDIVTYKFNLCENCLYEMFLEFKNPPEIGMFLF